MYRIVKCDGNIISSRIKEKIKIITYRYSTNFIL